MRHSTEHHRRFEVLYREHLDAVTAWAARRTEHRFVQDIVAETFLIAWRRLDAVPADPLPWLLVTARNVLANTRRTSERQADLTARLAAEGHEAPDLVLPGALDADLKDALDALAERDRELLLLIAWDELTIAQAAQVLGCTPVTARVRLHRARRRLARLVPQHVPHRPHSDGAARPPRPQEAPGDEPT